MTNNTYRQICFNYQVYENIYFSIAIYHQFVELLLRLGTQMLEDGDSINITSIGADPGNTLVCNTTNVNMDCCRRNVTGFAKRDLIAQKLILR